MSTLDDAYQAAAEANENWTPFDDEAPHEAVIDAFLAHLAENPPEEMVEAGAEALLSHGNTGMRLAREDDAKAVLSAAFRSIGATRAA